MRLIIHRGAREIGGSCVELVNAGGNRILLDLGMPLTRPDGSDWPRGTAARLGEDLRSEGVLPDIPGLYRGDDPEVGALVLSHAHLDHYGLAHHLHPSIPVWGSYGTLAVLQASKVFISDVQAPANLHELPTGRAVELAGFNVTALPVDHAAPDSRALLVEADGQSVLYSGDFRAHGRATHLFQALIDDPPSVDVLLLEGTTVGQAPGSHGYPGELEVESALAELFRSHSGLVVIAASGQNVGRLVSAYNAAQAVGRELVIDPYQAYVLRALAALSPDLPQFDWPGVRVKFVPSQVNRLKGVGQYGLACEMSRAAKVSKEEIISHPEHFALMARSNGATVALLSRLEPPNETAIVWSLWGGYWLRANPLRAFCEAQKIVPLFIHAGGHAGEDDLQDVVTAVSPKVVVPIHTDHAARFADIYQRVRLVTDGCPVEISALVA